MQIDSTPVGIPANPFDEDAATALEVNQDFARLDDLIASRPNTLADLTEVADLLVKYFHEPEADYLPLQKVLGWLPGACRRLQATTEQQA